MVMVDRWKSGFTVIERVSSSNSSVKEIRMIMIHLTWRIHSSGWEVMIGVHFWPIFIQLNAQDNQSGI